MKSLSRGFREYLGWLLDSGEYAAFAEPALPTFSYRKPHFSTVEYRAIAAREPESIRLWLESVLGRERVMPVEPIVADPDAFEVPF